MQMLSELRRMICPEPEEVEQDIEDIECDEEDMIDKETVWSFM